MSRAAGQGVSVRDDEQGEVFPDAFGLEPGHELKIKAGVWVEFRVLAHTTGAPAEEVVVLGVPEE